jgi:hypothetical protein
MQLSLVGEDQIDRAAPHQLEKFAAIAIHTKRIRQRQRDLAAGLMGNRRRLHKGFLGAFGVPQITFQINERGSGDLICIDIGRHQLLRRAEIGVHRTLAIGRHQNIRAAGRRTVAGGLCLEGDASGTNVVRIQMAYLVIPHLADIGGAGAETRDANNGVGCRSARYLGRRSHVAIDRGRAVLIDQRHAALGHAMTAQKPLIGLHQHIEDGIADPEYVVFRCGHVSVLTSMIRKSGNRFSDKIMRK